MLTLSQAIETARIISRDESADQIVGEIDGAWYIASADDTKRRAQMVAPIYMVTSDGATWEMED